MALLLVLGPVLLPRGDRRERPLDLPGAVLSLGGVLCTIFGIKQWAADGLGLRFVVAAFALWRGRRSC